MNGYLHPKYSESLLNIGQPIYLPRSKGWLIKRSIPGTDYFDAMGPYPLFFCENYQNICDDLDELREELVSVSFVIDPVTYPLFKYSTNCLDVFTAYRNHYLLDLTLPFSETISKNKRRNARRALRILEVDIDQSPFVDVTEWVDLYDCLIKKHQISDLRRFSYETFQKQLSIPGTLFFKAVYQDQIVGGNIFFIQGDVAYSHLSAFTDKGYELGASYAIKWKAIEHLRKFVKIINFGGGVKREKSMTSGLELFKKGWSNRIEAAYLCGKILNPNLYSSITELKYKTGSQWFPAYREGEFD
jgi:hypothetical protein